MNKTMQNVKLTRKLDRVFARVDDGRDEVPVKLVWARPITGRGREVSVVGEDKHEVAMLSHLDSLDPQSRLVAEEELEQRYLTARISRVCRATASFGNRYWDVETDRGRRRFLMKDPAKNVVWLSDDRMIIRDALGNRYEIESLAALDIRSRTEVDKVI